MFHSLSGFPGCILAWPALKRAGSSREEIRANKELAYPQLRFEFADSIAFFEMEKTP
jgi:hypothetical protein